MTRNSENGYGAIHMACKFNIRTVFDMLTSRGVSMEMLDSNGNSPLHYAARAGAIDICKLLVDSGCNPAKRNSHHQTAYDCSQNHIIRQYLLPIQLKAEAGSQPQQLGISSDASYGYKYADPAPVSAPPGGAGPTSVGMQQPPYQTQQPQTMHPPPPPPPLNMPTSTSASGGAPGMLTVDLNSPPQQQVPPTAADPRSPSAQP